MQTNEAGGLAYRMSPEEGLAQLVSTGCLSNTLYVSDTEQLDQIIKYAKECNPKFVAKAAVYSYTYHKLKRVPALLCAILATNQQNELLNLIFPKIINNGKMLRHFSDIILSGILGRKSFGSGPKRLIQNWFNSHTPDEIFDQSVGNPSMRVIIKCAHPRPLDKTRQATYQYFLGRKYEEGCLPKKIKAFEAWKRDGGDVPNVDFRLLTSKPLSVAQWKSIIMRGSVKWLLKNLNNIQKYVGFNDEDILRYVSNTLSNREMVLHSGVLPYEILAAYKNALVPVGIRTSLNDAMEIAVENTPCISGNIFLLVDVSKSVTYPITGKRKNRIGRLMVASRIRCVDVEALFACSLWRKNSEARVICFNRDVVTCPLDTRLSIMENAGRIAGIATGGTNCSAAMSFMNKNNLKGDLVILFSDNQSWIESLNVDMFGRKGEKNKTRLQEEWEIWKGRNPKSKMVCVDVAPLTTTQVQEDKDVLNIGGWSDNVFELIEKFNRGESQNAVDRINRLEL